MRSSLVTFALVASLPAQAPFDSDELERLHDRGQLRVETMVKRALYVTLGHSERFAKDGTHTGARITRASKNIEDLQEEVRKMKTRLRALENP